jgi:hypothetical protein
MHRFIGWFQQSKWWLCLRSVQLKISILLCISCGQKNSIKRIFIKKCSLFTVGSVCHVKQFTTGLQTFHWWRRGWNGGAKVAETTVKRLPCCGFQRTGKAMGQVYQCWWRIRREINVFSRFEYHILHPFVTRLLTLPRTSATTSTCTCCKLWQCCYQNYGTRK